MAQCQVTKQQQQQQQQKTRFSELKTNATTNLNCQKTTKLIWKCFVNIRQ